MSSSNQLRTILMESHKRYSKERDIILRESRDTAIIFQSTPSGHGNFHPLSYSAIQSNPKWAVRLEKQHSHFPDSDVKELDSSSSSDALLMNIFCHPKLTTWTGPLKLLGLDSWSTPEFGWDPKFPNETTGRSTECDMRVGDVIFEAKLTETDFQSKHIDVVRRYPNVTELFDLSLLSTSDGQVRNYQLIRNIVAASVHSLRFTLLVDARRPDLIRELLLTLLALNDRELASRCAFLTWQELVESLGQELREFLELKYAFGQ